MEVFVLNIAEIIGKNLKEIQKEYDYNQKELGEIIGVTRQTMAKYINGERILDSGKLYKLAKHFNKSFDYFLSFNENNQVSFMFRADDPANNFNKGLKNQISKRFNLYHDIIELSELPIKDYLPEEYNLDIKGKKLSSKEKQAIAKIAEKQRRYMGINDVISTNIFSLFEENNINVIADKMDKLTLDAVSAYSQNKGAYIFINDNKSIPEERKIFSLVHELGHLLLHRNAYSKDWDKLKYTNSRIKDIREKAADYFAMNFLIPTKVLDNLAYYFDGYVDLDLIIDKKKEFGVSAKCLIMALNENGMIERSTLGFLYKKLRDNGFEKQEPEPLAYLQKNEKLFALTKKLLIQGKLTTNKAAEVLNISLKEMRELLKRWKNFEYKKN